LICSGESFVDVTGGVDRRLREFGRADGSIGDEEDGSEEVEGVFRGEATIDSRKGWVDFVDVCEIGTVGGSTEGGGRMMN
jgi:hypothetical protein